MNELKHIRVEIPKIGTVTANGNFSSKRPIVAYIHEFLGIPFPPKELEKFIDFSFCLPGYEQETLDNRCPGQMLTWETYGKCIAQTIAVIDKPIILVGNSMGVMVGIYACLELPHLIEKLVLYRVPTFGEKRILLKERYTEIATSITGEEEFNNFLNSIQTKVSSDILKVIKKLGWHTVKKLYQGASLSDIDLSLLKHLKHPIVFAEQQTFDWVHPKESRDLLFSYLPKIVHKKIVPIAKLIKSDFDS